MYLLISGSVRYAQIDRSLHRVFMASVYEAVSLTRTNVSKLDNTRTAFLKVIAKSERGAIYVSMQEAKNIYLAKYMREIFSTLLSYIFNSNLWKEKLIYK